MVQCSVCQEMVSPLFQGFLYVFGGMLDSAYTSRRHPLWVFDIGEFHLQMTKPVAARLFLRNIQYKGVSCVHTACEFSHSAEASISIYQENVSQHFLCFNQKK